MVQKFKRIFLIVLDSVGIGEANDAKNFGDVGAHTLNNISKKVGLHLPNLAAMGLGNIAKIDTIKPAYTPSSYYTFLAPQSQGKDSIAGHWELMGCILNKPFRNFCEHGFPIEMIQEFEKRTNKKVIGNKEANGVKIIHELGEKHINNSSLIVYTSIDSTFQIAAHEEIIPIEDLYSYCKIARELSKEKPEWMCARIIARPFVGINNIFTRTENRKDYALDPFQPIVIEGLKSKGLDVIGLGKIYDLYNGIGITKSMKTKNNEDGFNKIVALAQTQFNGIAFLNLVDFDSVYGHSRDVVGYKNALEKFDNLLPQLLDKIHQDDLLMITADHGNDPTFRGNDHTRENVPLLVYSPCLKQPKGLNIFKSFSDVGATIANNFDLQFQIGKSFLDELQ